jgi:hypothetical protein
MRLYFSYTLIAAADIDGFIVEACAIIRRKNNNADPDPDAGTINGERFEHWVQFSLVPTLGIM